MTATAPFLVKSLTKPLPPMPPQHIAMEVYGHGPMGVTTDDACWAVEKRA